MEDPTQTAALFDLGNTLLRTSDPQAAVAAFQHCRTTAPHHAGILYNLGNALLQARRPVEAVEAFLSCLRLAPDFSNAYVNLAETLRRLTLLSQARQMAEQAVQLLPGQPQATLCLANVLHDSADYAAAADVYRHVLATLPNHAGALSSLGNTLRTMGHLTEALAMHDRAVAAAPATVEFRFNRSLARLAAGDFPRGWSEYEVRWQRPQARQRGFGESWQGQDIAGRTILLHAEQGLGDTLQFVRYAPVVANTGAHVVLEVQPALLRLLQGSMPFAQVLARGDDLPPFDTHCPLLSLPRAFTTTLHTIPAIIPYLHADPARITAWNDRLAARNGLRVGLVWAGSPHADDAGMHLIDQRRSLRPADLAPLAGIPGVHWVSLQKDRPSAAVLAGMPLTDPMTEMIDFADSAALIASLDLVISVDTSVAHLAGALGRPVWLLSRYDGCWRWLHARDDSPWYPSMQIYRQERPLDWVSVISRIITDLAALTAST